MVAVEDTPGTGSTPLCFWQGVVCLIGSMSLRGLGSVAIGSIAVPRMLQVINEAISQEYSGALVAGSVFAVGLHALYSWAYSTLRMRIMLGRFMKARMVGRIRPPHHIIERKALVEYLVQVFCAPSPLCRTQVLAACGAED